MSQRPLSFGTLQIIRSFFWGGGGGEVVPCHSPDVWRPPPGTGAAGVMSLAVKS